MSNELGKYRKQFKKGDVVMKQGEQGSQLFLPEAGTLDVYIRNRKVGTIDASISQDFIGEIGAVLGTPRTATVIASSDCVILCLPRIDLESLLKQSPALGSKLIRSLCRKLCENASALSEFQGLSTAVAQTKSTEVSLKNYMKGVLGLMEAAAADVTGPAAQQAVQYFVETNPWAILYGDPQAVLGPAASLDAEAEEGSENEPEVE
ncbi:MAG: cyclic nucleotide-binding domain-containing protein [Deltaproteobacteria bacterium]|nr:cyclic nucleotide-binding domain-containing protein [Deltaproteobacteria bacterium]